MKLQDKLFYSCGSIATAISLQAFSTYIIFFYVDIAKLPAFLAALGMTIFAFWNALNDPLAGYLSDHTKSRWGRRIPYIALGAVPLGLVFYLLWQPPFAAHNQVWFLFAYFLIMICLFDTFYTLSILNWSCLYPEMFTQLKERTQVNTFRQTFGLLGLVFGIAVPPLLYGRFGWPAMGAVLGGMITLSLLVALSGSRENLDYCKVQQLCWWDSIKYVFKNPAFLIFVSSNFLVQFAFMLVLAVVPFYAKYVLGFYPGQIAVVLASAFICAVPMLYLWAKLTNRVGPKKAFMLAIMSMSLSLLPLFWLSSFFHILIVAILIAVGLAGILLVVDLLLSDIVDEDEIVTSTRREGIYFGLNTFILRLAIALEAFCLGLVFTQTGYNPYVFSQTREFLAGLRFLIAGLPIIALVLAFMIISFYPLVGGRRMRAIRQELDEIHSMKGGN